MTENEIMKSPWVFVDSNGAVKIIPQRLFQYLSERVYLKVAPSGNIYLYDVSGVWKIITPNICK